MTRQWLADGNTMVAESGNARIVEVDRDGKLDTGHYLVCHEGDGCVRECDPAGKGDVRRGARPSDVPVLFGPNGEPDPTDSGLTPGAGRVTPTAVGQVVVFFHPTVGVLAARLGGG